jgi:hypothetical protein
LSIFDFLRSRQIWLEKQGLVMRLGKEGGAAAALLRNQLTFWSSHPVWREERLFRRGRPRQGTDLPVFLQRQVPPEEVTKMIGIIKEYQVK